MYIKVLYKVKSYCFAECCNDFLGDGYRYVVNSSGSKPKSKSRLTKGQSHGENPLKIVKEAWKLSCFQKIPQHLA